MAQIKLIIMTKPLTLFSLWNDDYFAYFLDNSFHRYLLSTPLKIIETKSTLVSFKDFITIGQYKAYEYTATHDPNPFNYFFFSTERLAYKWTLFALILVALLYTSARTIALIVMRKFSFNLLSASFVVTCAYCITLLVYFAYSTDPIIMNRTSYAYSFLGKLPFDMIIWHWSSIGRNLFSRKSIIFLRTLMIIDVGVNIYRTVLLAVVLASNNVDDLIDITNLSISQLAIPVAGVIFFGGFSIWFGINAYRLKQHPEGFSKFTQLVYFSLIGLFANLIPLILPLIYPIRITPINTQDVILNTLHFICALVLLSIMGIRWPRHKDQPERKAPLGGMTTVGWITTVHDAPIYSK